MRHRLFSTATNHHQSHKSKHFCVHRRVGLGTCALSPPTTLSSSSVDMFCQRGPSHNACPARYASTGKLDCSRPRPTHPSAPRCLRRFANNPRIAWCFKCKLFSRENRRSAIRESYPGHNFRARTALGIGCGAAAHGMRHDLPIIRNNPLTGTPSPISHFLGHRKLAACTWRACKNVLY